MIPLNLKTNTGRCAPLAFQQSADLSGIVIPDLEHAALAYTRPPLADRACCSGDDGSAEPQPQFSVEEGAPTPPSIPAASWPVGMLNLRTNTGRCAPLAFRPPEVAVEMTENANISISYTRPPLRERGCCTGDDEDQVPQVIFTVDAECRYIALEDEFGFFALEDETGYFARECAMLI